MKSYWRHLIWMGLAFLALALPTAGVSGAIGFQDAAPVPMRSAVYETVIPAERTTRTVTVPSRRYGLSFDPAAALVTMDEPGAVAARTLEPNQIGLNRQIAVSVLDQGQVLIAPDGNIIRILSIRSTGADGLRLHFEDFDLPEGDEVYVYGQTAGGRVSGPFTARGIFGDGEFWSDTIAGDLVIIEHLSESGLADVRVTGVAHLLPGSIEHQIEPQILSCQVDASCFAEQEKNSVARIIYVSGSGVFVCTGAMLNNRQQDFTPFFLTANHCVSTETVARTVEPYWFYQTTACNSGVLRSDWTSSGTGSALLATNRNSDSTLLRIDGPIPSGVVFSGWDPSPRSSGTQVVGLHHPGGGVPPSTSSYLRRAEGPITSTSASCSPSGLINGYWIDWGSGVTEPGSSGSGLWASGFLIGTLSCGPANLTCSNRFALYGKFADFYPLISTLLDLGGGGTGCVSSVSPTQATFTATGGNGQTSVFAPSTCSWDAEVSVNWISIVSGASGTGNGTIVYTVASNPETAPRNGTITVQGKTHTVTQAGNTCTYSLSPTSGFFPVTGGASSFSVTASSSCGWTAQTSDSWIAITSGQTGTGNGTVNFTISPNGGVSQRTGMILVQGNAFTVTQSGIDCNYQVLPESRSFPASGGSGSVSVSTPAPCQWNAFANVAWISFTSQTFGLGPATVSYEVGVNQSPSSRSGFIVIQGQVHTVNQNGLTCDVSLNPESLVFAPAGGVGTLQVQASTGCAWNASSDADWLMLNGSASGAGNGSVQFTVAGNPNGEARTARIGISDRSTMVMQIGNDPVITAVRIEGKHLYISGFNFDLGAKLFVDGLKRKKTFNDIELPTTLLFAKKAAKKIAPGQTVVLRVRNKDGRMSAESLFTRPASEGAASRFNPVRPSRPPSDRPRSRQVPRVQAPG